jgi:hypothetical protein
MTVASAGVGMTSWKVSTSTTSTILMPRKARSARPCALATMFGLMLLLS